MSNQIEGDFTNSDLVTSALFDFANHMNIDKENVVEFLKFRCVDCSEQRLLLWNMYV